MHAPTGRWVEVTPRPVAAEFRGAVSRSHALPLEDHPELARMVSDLLEGARRRDPSLIAPWLADEIGGAEISIPRHEFLAGMSDWPDEEWADFRRVLEFGLVFEGEDDVVAPHAMAVADLGEFVVVHDQASVHFEPDASSVVTGSLGRMVFGDGRPDGLFETVDDLWYRISAGEVQGYVSKSDVYQVGEMRLYFHREPHGWRLTIVGGGC